MPLIVCVQMDILVGRGVCVPPASRAPIAPELLFLVSGAARACHVMKTLTLLLLECRNVNHAHIIVLLGWKVTILRTVNVIQDILAVMAVLVMNVSRGNIKRRAAAPVVIYVERANIQVNQRLPVKLFVPHALITAPPPPVAHLTRPVSALLACIARETNASIAPPTTFVVLGRLTWGPTRNARHSAPPPPVAQLIHNVYATQAIIVVGWMCAQYAPTIIFVGRAHWHPSQTMSVQSTQNLPRAVSMKMPAHAIRATLPMNNLGMMPCVFLLNKIVYLGLVNSIRRCLNHAPRFRPHPHPHPTIVSVGQQCVLSRARPKIVRASNVPFVMPASQANLCMICTCIIGTTRDFEIGFKKTYRHI